jgi:hypothetical protein
MKGSKPVAATPKTRNKGPLKSGDVDLDDIMRASMATDFDAQLFSDGQKNNLQEFFD